MGLELLPILLPLPVPLAVVAVASGVETALFSLSYHDRLRLKRLSPRSAAATTYLLARPRALLVLVLFVTMAAGTIYFALTSLALLASDSAALDAGLAVVNLLAMTLVGEIVSKVLAARYRVEVARLAAPWVLAAFRACLPVVVLIERLVVGPLTRVLVPEHRAEGLTEEELDALLHLGSREGAIDTDERRVLGQVIRLSGLRVRDVMTHRVDIQWLEDTAQLPEVSSLVRAHRLTRVPIVKSGEDIDHGVIGLLNVKAYLSGWAEAAQGGTPGPAVADLMDPVRYVPASASLDKLLEHFRSGGTKLGLVVDEHGTVVGIVSTENVVSRLTDELTRDEEAELESQVRQIDGGAAQPAANAGGRWAVPGRLSVREWADMFGLTGSTVEGRVSTVAGLIFAKLGRVPKVGDSIVFGNVRLEVLSMDPTSGGRVVQEAAVSLVATATPERGGAA